jgi:hypothetical protein
LIGVGSLSELKKITIRWPSGIVSTLERVKTDQTYQVVEPKDGVAQPAPRAQEKPADNTRPAVSAKSKPAG